MWLPGQRLDTSVGLCVILKRRFTVDTASATCAPSEAQTPVAMMAEYQDPENPAASSHRRAPELAVEKRRVDVMVLGAAHAPGGRPVKEFEVGLKITGLLEERLRIIGPRVVQWRPPRKVVSARQRGRGKSNEWSTPTFSEPEPITRLPLQYEYAYGGFAPLVVDEIVAQRAAEMAEEEAEKEARRERKKEVVEELLAPPAPEPEPEGAVAEAEMAAFSGDSGEVLAADAEPLAPSEPSMEVVSALRLGGGDATEEPAPESPPMNLEEGTALVDTTALEQTGTRDELKALLDERDREAARALRDKDGTQRLRGAGAEEVALSDDGWVEDREEAPPTPVEASDAPRIPYPGNPSGRGFCLSGEREGMDGIQLPSVELPGRTLRPEDLLRDMAELPLDEIEAAAGWGPYGMGWFPRASLMGVYPWDVAKAEAGVADALKAYDPDDPDDAVAIEALQGMDIPVMQVGWYQEANPRLQVERLDGHEDVHVENMTPDGHLYFRLPGTHPRGTIDVGQGEERLAFRLDTLTIDLEDPSAPAVELIWRAWRPLASYADLEASPGVDVQVETVDQARWLADQRLVAKERAAAPAPTSTHVLPMGDEDVAGQGEAAEARYKEDVRAATGSPEGVDAPSGDGTRVFDQSRDVQVSDGSWDGDLASDGEDVQEEAAALEEAHEAERLAAARAKAREIVDEEFGRTKKGKKRKKRK